MKKTAFFIFLLVFLISGCSRTESYQVSGACPLKGGSLRVETASNIFSIPVVKTVSLDPSPADPYYRVSEYELYLDPVKITYRDPATGDAWSIRIEPGRDKAGKTADSIIICREYIK